MYNGLLSGMARGIDPAKGYRDVPIQEDRFAQSIGVVGTELITDAMQRRREETLMKWKDKNKAEQYGREDERNKVLDARYDSEQEYMRDRNTTKDKYAADDRAATAAHRKLMLEGQQQDRAATADYRAQQSKFNQQNYEQGLLEPKHYFVDDKGRKMMILANGETVPATEMVDGQISTNEAAFNAPFEDQSSLGQYGYENAGKKPVYTKEKSDSKFTPAFQEQVNHANAAIEAYNKAVAKSVESGTPVPQKLIDAAREAEQWKVANNLAPGEPIARQGPPPDLTLEQWEAEKERRQKSKAGEGLLDVNQQAVKDKSITYSGQLESAKASKNPQKLTQARKEKIKAAALDLISKPSPDIKTGEKGTGRYRNRDMAKITSVKALEDAIEAVQLAITSGGLNPAQKMEAEQYVLNAQKKLNQ